MARLSLKAIQNQIEANGLDWVASANPISQLSEAQQDIRLGVDVPPGEQERVAAAIAAGATSMQATTHAASRDWRSVDGANYVTAIRDQGGCGSCVSFATVATVEAQARIERKRPTWDVDLSEAELFSCGGAKCANGWWPALALAYATDKGISDEACMPYEDRDQPCNVCADKADRMLQVGEWKEVAPVEARKVWLDEKGPMVACLAVYKDFMSYGGGIYRHATGELRGYHAVSCVGFDDHEGYWLCKNSWGPQWGHDGFFKIAYGEAEIDTRFAMFGVSGITGTLKPSGAEETTSAMADYMVVRSVAGGDVLFAHVAGAWRNLPLSSARLGDLGPSVFGADNVEVAFDDTRITGLSLWKKLGDKAS